MQVCKPQGSNSVTPDIHHTDTCSADNISHSNSTEKKYNTICFLAIFVGLLSYSIAMNHSIHGLFYVLLLFFVKAYIAKYAFHIFSSSVYYNICYFAVLFMILVTGCALLDFSPMGIFSGFYQDIAWLHADGVGQFTYLHKTLLAVIYYPITYIFPDNMLSIEIFTYLLWMSQVIILWSYISKLWCRRTEEIYIIVALFSVVGHVWVYTSVPDVYLIFNLLSITACFLNALHIQHGSGSWKIWSISGVCVGACFLISILYASILLIAQAISIVLYYKTIDRIWIFFLVACVSGYLFMILGTGGITSHLLISDFYSLEHIHTLMSGMIVNMKELITIESIFDNIGIFSASGQDRAFWALQGLETSLLSNRSARMLVDAVTYTRLSMFLFVGIGIICVRDHILSNYLYISCLVTMCCMGISGIFTQDYIFIDVYSLIFPFCIVYAGIGCNMCINYFSSIITSIKQLKVI